MRLTQKEIAAMARVAEYMRRGQTLEQVPRAYLDELPTQLFNAMSTAEMLSILPENELGMVLSTIFFLDKGKVPLVVKALSLMTQNSGDKEEFIKTTVLESLILYLFNVFRQGGIPDLKIPGEFAAFGRAALRILEKAQRGEI